MHWLDTDHVQAAVACLVACAVLGWFAPSVIARLPEPEAKPEPASDVPAPGGEVQRGDESSEPKLFARALPPPPPKEPYADIAALPHLSSWIAAWSGLVGASFGLAQGWTGALLYLVPLVPIGVVLVVIDWRTTLLPTRIIHPTYVLLGVLIPLAALVDRDVDALYRAGWGWLVIGGWFWIFWYFLGAWGFGDVRLSRVLGPALGFLGWPEMLIGLGLMVIVGGLGGAVLGIVHRSLRRRFPYGPFMLVGAVLAVLSGPWLARSLGY
jgi:leader peptidase (prepilin peptidase)/N-methyltransferase